jgi:diguanylate cyclase (GGDEF)-like protein
MLFDVAHSVVERGFLVEEVLETIFERFTGVIPYDRISCAFLSNDGVQLTAYWARSNLGDVRIAKGYSQVIEGSSLQELFRTGEPRILNDLEAYLAAKPESDATRRIVTEGGRSSLTCPLLINGRPLGVLFFTSREKNTYKDIHQAIFRQIADEVALVINKSRLFQELVESNQFLVRQAEQLKEVANRDSLTGVLNRSAIMVSLEGQLRVAATLGKTVGVIMIDIDHFKKVNDSFGHAAGDAVLREFTRRLTAVIRENDYLGRFGGEEFLLVIGDTNREQFLLAAERCRSAIAGTPFDLGTKCVSVTASFGLALAFVPAGPAEALIALADRALYAAKNSGRNQCVLA